MRSNIHQSRFRPVVAADIIVVVRRSALGLHRDRKGVVGLRGPDAEGAIRVQRRHPSIAIVESTSKSSCPSLLPLLLPPQSAFRRLIHTTPLSSADDDDGRRTVPEANTILPARPQRHCCWHCRIDARPKSRGPTPRKTTTTSHHANIHR